MFSAAQALYLAKTAEMNDLEFEAFKINTSRTQLSQEANQLGNRMAGLDVPVPPLASDFTRIQYSYMMGTDNVTISRVVPRNENYDVTISMNTHGDYMDYRGDYRVNLEEGRFLVGDTELVTMAVAHLPDEQLPRYINAIRNTFEDYASEDLYPNSAIMEAFMVYKEVLPSNQVAYHFIERADLDVLNQDRPEDFFEYYDYIMNGSYTTETTLRDCLLQFDAAGRITQISVPSSVDAANDAVRYTHYPVTATQVTDNVAYEDAYNKYQYKKHLYEQEQSELEQKIQVIQRQDKGLELQLTELENKRNALKAEMEGLKKVIEDATEGFKTFA